MKKFGGPNRLRQKCRLRQCRNYVSYLLLVFMAAACSFGHWFPFGQI